MRSRPRREGRLAIRGDREAVAASRRRRRRHLVSRRRRRERQRLRRHSNPGPWGGSRFPNGAWFGGSTLYTDSLVVLAGATGKLLWYDQVTPHDVRDYDFEASPILATLGGNSLVFGAGKAGRVVAWNRDTHARLWSRAVGTHLHDLGPLPRDTTTVCPGLLGGVETPMALAGGRLFVPVVELCCARECDHIDERVPAAAVAGQGSCRCARRRDRKTLWQRQLGSPPFGCATVARDAVIVPTYDGTLAAFSAADGRRLWHVRLPAGNNSCPAVGRISSSLRPERRIQGIAHRRRRSSPSASVGDGSRHGRLGRGMAVMHVGNLLRRRAVLVGLSVVGIAVGVAIVVGAVDAGSPRYIVFSGTPTDASPQLYRSSPPAATCSRSRPERMPPSTRRTRPAVTDRVHAPRRRDLHDESRRDGASALTTGARDSYPAWAPTGGRIAFVRPVGAAWRVFVMSTSGGTPRRLAKAPPSGRPSWTKAGLFIPSGGDLLRIDLKTGRVLKYYGANIDAIWGLNTSRSRRASRSSRLSAPAPLTRATRSAVKARASGSRSSSRASRPRRRRRGCSSRTSGPRPSRRMGGELAYAGGGQLLLRSVASGSVHALATQPSLRRPPRRPPGSRGKRSGRVLR